MAESEYFPNIQRYRKAKGISIKQMIKKTGMSADHYEGIETGKSNLYSDELEIISEILDVSEHKLTYPADELQNVRFRSNQKLKNRELIILEVEHWLNEYNFIEEFLGDCLSNPIEEIGKQIQAKNMKIEEAARITREKIGLRDDVLVSNICGLLESNGIKVGEYEVESHDFFGLSISPDDGGPAIVVNNWDQIPVERWIFTAAHELGHLVLHQSDFNVGQTVEGKKHEKEANEFASEFLMPDSSFREVWYDLDGLPFVERVIKVKRIFRVSYKTVLHRIANLLPNSGNIWARFHFDYKKNYGKPLLRNDEPDALAKDAFRASFPEHRINVEPEKLSPADFKHGRFIHLVKKALEEKKISLGRGAEILQITRQELRELAKSWYS